MQRPISTRGQKPAVLTKIVFAWFKKYGRDLPWRRTSDPYAIALSEIMLQQTQVDRVIPKWRNFLSVFPTWVDLANGKTSDVLRLWKGLGYNRRAIMLHRLAKSVVESGEALGARGELPNDIEAMMKLPGIGAYTANAIAAFAFRNPEAAPVDTNIVRILRRCFPRHRADAKSTQKLAYEIRPKDVWTWNHALMDIGALHCTARNHEWGLCPLSPIHGSRAPRISPPYEGASKGEVKKRTRVRFEDTDRYFRGRIVDQLREGPMAMKKLRAHPIFHRIDDGRFATLVEGLIKDDVIVIKNGKLMLNGDG